MSGGAENVGRENDGREIGGLICRAWNCSLFVGRKNDGPNDKCNVMLCIVALRLGVGVQR